MKMLTIKHSSYNMLKDIYTYFKLFKHIFPGYLEHATGEQND